MIGRLYFQLISAILTNGYLKGFVSGRIYTGDLKHVCVPTLNCYSCPGAMFSCPVGAVQVILAGGGGLDPTAQHSIREKLSNILSGTPMFVVGFLTLVGALIGRATCGWACPFGMFQDLMYKTPLPKALSPRFLRFGKYVVLLVAVILLPSLWVDATGFGKPVFCEYICPAGTLEGGLILPLLNKDLRGMLGWLFMWKLAVLAILVLLMTGFRRPFCAWLCPLGAYLSIFNRASIWKLKIASKECSHCQLCAKACPTGLEVETELDGPDCIRCLDCSKACPKKLITIHGPLCQTPEGGACPEKVSGSVHGSSSV